MRFCPNCGTQLADAAKFCTQCGKKMPEVMPVAPAPRNRLLPLMKHLPLPLTKHPLLPLTKHLPLPFTKHPLPLCSLSRMMLRPSSAILPPLFLPMKRLHSLLRMKMPRSTYIPHPLQHPRLLPMKHLQRLLMKRPLLPLMRLPRIRHSSRPISLLCSLLPPAAAMFPPLRLPSLPSPKRAAIRSCSWSAVLLWR